MSLEVIHGRTNKQIQARRLQENLEASGVEGTLLIGYPIIASADDRIEVDALLVGKEHGLVAFALHDGSAPATGDATGWSSIRDFQDRLYFAIKNSLSRHESLRRGRELSIEVNTATVFPGDPNPPSSIGGKFIDIREAAKFVRSCGAIQDELLPSLLAALQRVSTMKPAKKRTNVTSATSRGAMVKTIEKEIANLDHWQKKAAIETPDGPQRIRGLAGSGKTVVLALKAAYLHAQHPDWTIVVGFHTRSLYQQFTDLIRRFSFEHSNDEPDWEKLQIKHAWGGSDRLGIYAEIADVLGVPARNFVYARATYGMENAFQGVCEEVLSLPAVKAGTVSPIYDAALIDEAQDLPPAFFQLLFAFTKTPKRIVWAYDELQKLSQATMPSTTDIFGTKPDGTPRVSLSSNPSEPRQDVVLPVCYRNTPWALTLAHALGFGIYRKHGLVQHFDEPALWTEVGYQIHSGDLEPGDEVDLVRATGSYPQYFSNLLQPSDAVVVKSFQNEAEQTEAVVGGIARNLRGDELDYDDILVVLPDAYAARKRSQAISEALRKSNIQCHLAGVTTSRDELFVANSIALANIYRSKGNEAPMVYIVDAQYCYSGPELQRLRNVLFTAITRSRAWVRIFGWGPEMAALSAEINGVITAEYHLRFRIPTAVELARIRRIHRERSDDERARIRRAEKGLRVFLDAVRRGDLELESLPPDLRTAIVRLAAREERAGDGDG